MGSTITVCTLSTLFSEPHIHKNDHIEYALETLRKSDIDSIYSLITTLLRFNSLGSKESYQIGLALLANEENRSHFLEDNRFCQVIYKYTSAITSQEMEVLVAYKTIRLPIFKVNIEILGKFDAIYIA